MSKNPIAEIFGFPFYSGSTVLSGELNGPMLLERLKMDL